MGGFSRHPSLSSLRKTALAAAEKRVKLGSLLPSQPKRLGGDSTIMAALSPIQAAAMAAERRLQDEIWCGSLSAEASANGENSSDITEDLVYMEEMTECSRLYNGRKRGCESNKRTDFLSSSGLSESIFVDLSEDVSTSGSILDHGTGPRKKICKLCKNSSRKATLNIEYSFTLSNASSFWYLILIQYLSPRRLL